VARSLARARIQSTEMEIVAPFDSREIFFSYLFSLYRFLLSARSYDSLFPIYAVPKKSIARQESDRRCSFAKQLHENPQGRRRIVGRSHRSARSINISRQMSNRSVTRTRMYTHTQLSDTRARVIRSVTISRKSIIKPLSCRGYNGRGELFRAGCIVPAGLELSARHAHGDTPRCVRATNAWQFARMTRIIEMDVD